MSRVPKINNCRYIKKYLHQPNIVEIVCIYVSAINRDTLVIYV